MVAGLRILYIPLRLTSLGHHRTDYRFRCPHCPNVFDAAESIVTRAVNGHVRLCCARCRTRNDLAQQWRATPAPPVAAPVSVELPVHRRIAGLSELPQLAATTNRLIAKAAPDVLGRAKGIVAAHLRASLANGAPLESPDRLWIEALELAARNNIGDDWTRETIHDGLCVVSYGQYTSPLAGI